MPSSPQSGPRWRLFDGSVGSSSLAPRWVPALRDLAAVHGLPAVPGHLGLRAGALQRAAGGEGLGHRLQRGHEEQGAGFRFSDGAGSDGGGRGVCLFLFLFFSFSGDGAVFGRHGAGLGFGLFDVLEFRIRGRRWMVGCWWAR